MTDNNHPITPPPELVEQWCHKWTIANGDFGPYLATQAARWGADMELVACCEWLRSKDILEPAIEALRADRRPKTLKERGREALQNIHAAVVMETGGRELDVLKKIVESLPD